MFTKVLIFVVMATGAELKSLFQSYADINDDALTAMQTAYPDFIAGNLFIDPVSTVQWMFKMFVCYQGQVGALFAYVDDSDVEQNFHDVLVDPVLSSLELVAP